MHLSDLPIQLSVLGALASCNLLFATTSAAAESVNGKCRLFADGEMDQRKTPIKVTSIKSVFLKCSNGVDERIAIRDLKIAGEKQGYYLLVDAQTLKTSIERQGCFRCEPSVLTEIETTRFGSAVAKVWPAPKKKEDVKDDLVNAGFRTGSAGGSYLTADLCPSSKPLDREFLEFLTKVQKAAPIAFSVSGRWMEKHTEDVQWLKSELAKGDLEVVWMNHSYHHTYDADEDDDVNFMRTKGTNVRIEILRTERVIIENGLTPSIFFRFPGLISDEKLMDQLRTYSLVPVGTAAWLQHLEMPKDGAIMLVHANGNEPGGLARFKTLISRKQIPLPLLPLTKAPTKVP